MSNKENSTYFAKYLPIEGEMKKGDKFVRSKDDICTFIKWLPEESSEAYPKVSLIQNSWAEEEGVHKYFGQNIKPHKLFLCSKDIQVGHNVWFEGQEYKNASRALVESAPLDTFKVIGEISSMATWVKEGDKFNESQLSKETWYEYGNGASGCRHWMKPEDKVNIGDFVSVDGAWKVTKVIKSVIFIKGPCGHFH